MANSLLYLIEPISKNKVLLAKGWENGWEIFYPETLSMRLQELFNKCRDDNRELGSINQDRTELILEIK